MMFGVAASLLALAASSDIRIATPEGSGEVSLALVELSGGALLNFLDFPDENGSPDGVDSSLFEHRGTVVLRTLAGPHLPQRVTVRRIYPEMASMRRDPVVYLAVLERTNAGYWHIQWEAEVRDGRACLSDEAIAHYGVVVPGSRPDPEGAICLDV